MKRVTVSFDVNDDTNENAFKDWVKSCPYSHESGQSLKWENIPTPATANDAGEAKTENHEAAQDKTGDQESDQQPPQAQTQTEGAASAPSSGEQQQQAAG